MYMKIINCIALLLCIIGAINWGLIGVMNVNVVSSLFGDMSMLSRIIYVLVGISGLYLTTFFWKLDNGNM